MSCGNCSDCTSCPNKLGAQKQTYEERRERVLNDLVELANHPDPLHSHIMADLLLLELIADDDITEAFENLEKWYE